jgi:threonine dehydratase
MITFVDVEEARERIQNQIYLSPFAFSETISRSTGNRVFFKLENLQMTGSFKERGALNRLLTLTPDEAKRGVIAASAGNHGMAVAFHSHRLNISATIVMPLHAPLIKVTRVRQYGAQTVLHGADYDEAFAEAYRLAQERGLIFIHAFDDPWIVAGQGTIGLELYEQNRASHSSSRPSRRRFVSSGFKQKPSHPCRPLWRKAVPFVFHPP